MGLPAGIYRVSHCIPPNCFRGPKLGDIRLTPACELLVPPDVIAFLWAGDTVALLEEDVTPMILPTGELRILVQLLYNNFPGSQCGWAPYSPDSTTTWFSHLQPFSLPPLALLSPPASSLELAPPPPPPSPPASSSSSTPQDTTTNEVGDHSTSTNPRPFQ